MPARGLVSAHHARILAIIHLLLPLGHSLLILFVAVGNITLRCGKCIHFVSDDYRFFNAAHACLSLFLHFWLRDLLWWGGERGVVKILWTGLKLVTLWKMKILVAILKENI